MPSTIPIGVVMITSNSYTREDVLLSNECILLQPLATLK